jgi:hypothetical protein
VSARVRAEAVLGLLALAALGGTAGCRPTTSFDPRLRARSILEACAGNSSCVRERWRRDPRDWNLGLRAEVAGRGPRDPLVVETTREIVVPELRDSACLPRAAPEERLVFFQTSVGQKSSAAFPFVVFRWSRFEDALIGHRRVVAATADARGDEESLWERIRDLAALERACIRFRGRRDRCRG